MDINSLIKAINQCCFNVRLQLCKGYLESVYHKALLIELRNYGLEAKSQFNIPVTYKGENVGHFIADVFVENSVIVEIKASEHITKENEAQLVNYLTATGVDHGLLVNFGSDILEIKRKFRVYTPKPIQVNASN